MGGSIGCERKAEEVGGFEYGLNLSVFKSSVTSRKLTTFLFASAGIFRLFFANIWHICFFFFSLSLSPLVFDLVWQARHLCKGRFRCRGSFHAYVKI